MATGFPTTLDELTNPSSSDTMNSPTVPHATQHSNANDAIETLQLKVGVNGSADQDSIDYKLANHTHDYEASGAAAAAVAAHASGDTHAGYAVVDPVSSDLGSVSGAVTLTLTNRNRHFRFTQAGITTLTFAGLGATGLLSQFHFELTTTATLYTLTLPAGWVWDKNTTPTFAISKTYVIAAETFDCGVTGRFYLASEF